MNLPPIKPTPTITTLNAAISNNNDKGACSSCGSNNRWFLHNVQIRGMDRRVCTSCVLKLHPSSFCPSCFEFFDHPLSTTSSASSHLFQSCIKCSSLTHVRCLPSPCPLASTFLCPPCSEPNFSFFDIDNSDSTLAKTNLVLNKKIALVLLCAAKIASASMFKAASIARMKADRNVREAALARKRAKEALQHVFAIDKAKRIEGFLEVSGSRNLGCRNKDKVQMVVNPGLKLMSKQQDFGGFAGHNKVPSVPPQNGLSVNVQDANKKIGVPGSGVGPDSFFSGGGTTSVMEKSANDRKLGSNEGDLERLQCSHGRVVDVSSR